MERTDSRWSALGRLRATLGTPLHDYVPSARFFPDIDCEKLANELNPQARGRERGGRDIPATDDAAFDEVEATILERIGTARRDAVATLFEQTELHGNRLAALAIESRSGMVAKDAREAIADFRTEVHQGRDELFGARSEVIDSQADLEKFKRRNGLERSATYPKSHILHVGGLFILFALEGVANGSFLARGSAFGLLGGVVQALTIAALNIVVAYLVGLFVLRELFHRSVPRRMVGAFGTGAWMAFLLAFNLGVAHYREALGSADPGAAELLVLERLSTTPLAITEPESVFLLLVGILFGVIALIDGFKWDDPYPGFGREHRKRRDAEETYTRIKAYLLARLEDRKNEAVEAMNAARDDLVRRRAEFDSILQAQARLERSFKDHLDQLEQCANRLLRLYREANREVRSSPPPARFSTPWSLDRPEVTGLQTTPREQIEAVASAAGAAIDRELAVLFDAYDEAVARYEAIEHLPSLEMPGAAPA